MKHETTRLIFSYWDALRGERAAPERGEIEPGEIRHGLSDTFILEMGPSGGAAIRLAGTRMCALFGGELKGRAFDSLWAENTAGDPDALVELVIAETAGCVAGLVGRSDEGEEVHLEMILLPLRHRGKPQARILGAMAPLVVPSWIGFRPLKGLATLSMRVVTAPRPAPAPVLRAPPVAPIPRGRPTLTVHLGGRA